MSFCFHFNRTQIANHNLTVIATDGNAIEPIIVERIVLMHGERFDFVLKATSDQNLSKFIQFCSLVLWQ